jgi:16S rRNA (guanine966-N2)-methyltransferase
MRIISGKHRGKLISAPGSAHVRPTTDRAKESLFNILSNQYYLEDVAFLDAFAGWGNICFEMGSRGCEDITAIDVNARSTRFIEKTIEELGYEGVSVIKGNAFRSLEQSKKPYDIIFADPPYEMPNIHKIPDLVLDNNLLKPEGVLVIEHASFNQMPEHPRKTSTRKYGHTSFSFYQ